MQGLRCHEIARRVALHQRIGSGQQEKWFIALLLASHSRQPAKCRNSPGYHFRTGRNPIIGKAVPCRQLQHFELWRIKCERRLDGRQMLAVTCRIDQPGLAGLGRRHRNLGQYLRLVAFRNTGERDCQIAIQHRFGFEQRLSHSGSVVLHGHRGSLCPRVAPENPGSFRTWNCEPPLARLLPR